MRKAAALRARRRLWALPGLGSSSGLGARGVLGVRRAGSGAFATGHLPDRRREALRKLPWDGARDQHACSQCRGSGLFTTTEALTVTIPAGVEPGSTRTVTGGGNRTRPNKPPGDLEIAITVRPHPAFKRDGDDVLCSVPIPFAHAALGGEIDVPTLDGRAKLRIPAGTQPGSVLRVKGKGIPHRAGLGRGDQRVEVVVEVPSQLTARQRELLEALARELGEEVHPAHKSFMGKLRDLFG